MKRIAFRLWLSLCGLVLASKLTMSFMPIEHVASMNDAKKRFDRLESIDAASKAQNSASDNSIPDTDSARPSRVGDKPFKKRSLADRIWERADKIYRVEREDRRYSRSIQSFHRDAFLSFSVVITFLFLLALSLWGAWLIGDKWQVKGEGNERASAILDTQAEAWDDVKNRARGSKGEAKLQGRNGQIRERNTYGDAPYPPRDSSE